MYKAKHIDTEKALKYLEDLWSNVIKEKGLIFMKRFIASVVACIMILSGCSNVTVEDESQYNNKDTINSMFVVVERATLWFVVYNKDTKVMYAVSRGSYNGGNFTLLVNPDGTPMIWED